MDTTDIKFFLTTWTTMSYGYSKEDLLDPSSMDCGVILSNGDEVPELGCGGHPRNASFLLLTQEMVHYSDNRQIGNGYSICNTCGAGETNGGKWYRMG